MSPQVTKGSNSLSAHVANFIVSTRYPDIPAGVVALGKKSILDGLGLALAGSVAKSGELVRRHLQGLGCAGGTTSIIGTPLRVPARFAAFAHSGAGSHWSRMEAGCFTSAAFLSSLSMPQSWHAQP